MERPVEEQAERFRFGLGHVVLELLATLAGRDRDPHERLAEPHDLERWLDEAGLATAARCDQVLLLEARALREAIHRAVVAARAGHEPAAPDLDAINAWAGRPRPAPQLDARLSLAWIGPEPAPAALAQLAAAAVELLAGPLLARVRNCAAPGCSLLFIDHSRPGRRRWCSMAGCGNRVKTARYRERRREPAPAA